MKNYKKMPNDHLTSINDVNPRNRGCKTVNETCCICIHSKSCTQVENYFNGMGFYKYENTKVSILTKIKHYVIGTPLPLPKLRWFPTSAKDRRNG